MKSLYYHFKNQISPMECEQILSFALQKESEDAVVGLKGDLRKDESIRRSKVTWLKRDEPQLRWLFDRLVICTLEANMHCFNFVLDNEPRLSFEHGQFTEYHSETKGEYKWHRDAQFCDSMTGSKRKLSLCLQLSDPQTYEGGAFELEDADLKDSYKNQGDIIIFPSFQKHCVHPVTKGIRHSLVLWFHGPPLS